MRAHPWIRCQVVALVLVQHEVCLSNSFVLFACSVSFICFDWPRLVSLAVSSTCSVGIIALDVMMSCTVFPWPPQVGDKCTGDWIVVDSVPRFILFGCRWLVFWLVGWFRLVGWLGSLRSGWLIRFVLFISSCLALGMGQLGWFVLCVPIVLLIWFLSPSLFALFSYSILSHLLIGFGLLGLADLSIRVSFVQSGCPVRPVELVRLFWLGHVVGLA